MTIIVEPRVVVTFPSIVLDEFDVTGGTLTLDSSVWPHVQGTLTIPKAMGQEEIFNDLDPQAALTGVWVFVEDKRIEGDDRLRAFAAYVRRVREVDDETLEIEVSSEEAVLEDWAPGSDDTAGVFMNARALCNYVLGKIGAFLEPGTVDANLTPYWSARNEVPNASHTTLRGIRASVGASDFVVDAGATRWTAAAGTSRIYTCGYNFSASNYTDIPISANSMYQGRLSIRSSIARSARIVLQFRDELGRGVKDYSSPVFTTTVGTYTTISITGRAPALATHASLQVETTGNTAGQYHWVDGSQISEYDIVPTTGFFSGATTDANYVYEWEELANESPSIRTPLIERTPESKVWMAGVGGMSFLTPILQSVGLRLVCDQDGLWWLRNDAYRAPGNLTITYAENMIGYELTSDMERWCDAATVRYRWPTSSGTTRTQEDTYKSVPSPRRMKFVEVERPYPGKGRAQNIVQRTQQRARAATATALIDMNAVPEQPATLVTAHTTVTGLVGAVTFDLATLEMTVKMHRDDE